MKKLLVINSMTFALVMLLTSGFSNVLKAATQSTVTTVEEIIANPYSFADKSVTIRGFITQYEPAVEDKTAYYVVKGETGETMVVNTSLRKPKIQGEYKINGIVKLNATTQQPILVEMKKVRVIPVWLYAIFGAILLLVILLVIVMIANSSKKADSSIQPKSSEQKDPQYDSSFKTVQIVTDKTDKKTLVFIPGKLVFQNGEDKGKEIHLAGYQGTVGAVITIGSREETGDKKNSHIRLMEPTVSREQAELIMLNKDKKLVIKNLSNTNYTQVNSEEILLNAVKEIKPGDLIKAGEIEFKYTN
jgi:hypothetical protein